MNAIYQLLNPDNTISLNRPLAHAVGLMETVVYSALIAKWQYYSDRGKLDPGRVVLLHHRGFRGKHFPV